MASRIWTACHVSEALVKAFQENGIVGTVIELTPKGEDAQVIYSGFFPSEAISLTGFHRAVEVDGIVFDNIVTKGISRADWEASLSTLRGNFAQSFIVKTTPF
jgi:hypothetical protein